MMKVAAAYIRVSTDDQLEYSPDSQLSQIRRYAKTAILSCRKSISLSKRRVARAETAPSALNLCG